MGIVYMLCCKTTGEAYYGSTTLNWKRRLNGHRNTQNCVSKQIIERDNYEFVILEEVDEDQLLVREKYYITTFPCINYKSPFTTREEKLQYDKQYYQDHKEEQLQHKKQYYQDHKEEVKQRNSKPFECECGSVIQWGDKSRHFKSKKHLAFTTAV